MNRELIFITSPGLTTPRWLLDVQRAIAADGGLLRPLIERRAALGRYYRVFAPDERLEEIAQRLSEEPFVEAAYVKPALAPAWYPTEVAPTLDEAPAETPDFTQRQSYLDAAPIGIEARFLWTKPGGEGAGVSVIDIEGAWNFSHEDLKENKGGVVGGTPINDVHWRNHGTAVVGVIGGDKNSFGVTGICPGARVSAVSIFGATGGSASAIVKAASLLRAGDIILIELHRPGPRATGWGQQGFIALEWWPDDFDAIKYATNKGVIVVEAAGNGAEDLDHDAYNTPSKGFPKDWKNPFRRGDRDSGAILVGAGAPPPGTHGRSHGPDRSRLDFSNYGAAVDTQGWGREVTTCGYGDLQSGAEERWYTDAFSGTSSASPIVVGAVGGLQGVLTSQGKSPLTPLEMRELLRATGSLQTDAPGRPATQRIGNRPNLKEAYYRLLSRE